MGSSWSWIRVNRIDNRHPSEKGTLVYEISGNQLKLISETREHTETTAPSGQDKAPAR